MISVFWRLCFETVAFLVVASLVFFRGIFCPGKFVRVLWPLGQVCEFEFSGGSPKVTLPPSSKVYDPIDFIIPVKTSWFSWKMAGYMMLH